MSLFALASQKLPAAKNADGQLLTDGFLDLCQTVVPVIGACCAGSGCNVVPAAR